MSARSAVPDPSAAEPAVERAGGAVEPSAAAPMPVEGLEVLGVTEARNRLYELVDAARDEGRMTVVVKRDGKTHRTYRVALIPVGRLDAASRARLVGWPSWARTAARPKLGDRVIDAAGRPGVPGVPQVLLDRTTPLAVLVDAALVPPGDALVAVPVGGAPAPTASPAPAAAWADAGHLPSGASAAPQAHEAVGKGLPAARQVFAAPEASAEPAVDVADAASAGVSAAADPAVPPSGEGVAEVAVAASAGSGAAPVIAPLAAADRTADLQGAGSDSVGPDAAVVGRDAGAASAGHAAAEEAVGGRDTVAGRGVDGTARSAGTAEVPPPVPSAGGGLHRLHGLGEVAGLALTEAVAPSAVPRFGFGLRALDAALGSLPSGVLTVVAAEPHAGGSLLAVHAARHIALTRQLPVLYAASGLSRTDVAMRVVAGEAGLDYRRLRTGALTPDEQEAASAVQARLAAADLHVDDGTGLSAELIAETAPYVEGLALVVVDRFQHAADPFIPLSGPALPEAARVLAHLARTRNVPVVAVLDTADPDALAVLDAAHVTLTLTRTGNDAQVTVAERDFGELTTVVLRADVACARFTDAPARPQDPKAAHTFGGGKGEKATAGPAAEAAPGVALQTGPAPAVSAAVGEGFAAVEAELLDAALPFTSGARSGLSARLAGALAALREATAAPAREDELPGLRQALDGLAARRPPVPATPEGERLGAALAAFTATHRETPTSAPPPLPSPRRLPGTPVPRPVAPRAPRRPIRPGVWSRGW